MTLRVLAPLSLVLLLSACALSPQVVNLAPAPQVEIANVGRNLGVNVLVRDMRPEVEFGSRGGPSPESSLIRPGNDVPKAVYDAVIRSLQNLGFNAMNPGDDATRMEVRLLELNYRPAEGSVVNKVEADARLEVVASRNGVEHIGRYNSAVSHETGITPSASRNEQIINDVLERALTRFLNDARMRAFLAGNDRP